MNSIRKGAILIYPIFFLNQFLTLFYADRIRSHTLIEKKKNPSAGHHCFRSSAVFFIFFFYDFTPIRKITNEIILAVLFLGVANSHAKKNKEIMKLCNNLLLGIFFFFFFFFCRAQTSSSSLLTAASEKRRNHTLLE